MYHQLKNTQSLSWGKVDKQGDIAFDFAHQIEDCKERDEKFALKLVYSLKDSKVGEQTPEEIKNHTSAEYFDYSPDLNSLVIIKRILDAIEDLNYHISGRMFYWNIGRMNGSCPWPEEMETEIIRQHPTDKWNLISILS